MRVRYRDWSPGGDALVTIQRANTLSVSYASQGYDLTLRQLYYQFVSRDWLPNTTQSYKRLGDIVNKARLGGLIDWSHIVDRTRNLARLPHWETPADFIDADAFNMDLWATQPVRVEVWVEKEALAGVIARVADRFDCAYFSCRGYVSQSEMWGAAQRVGRYLARGQRVVVLHLGDHDPSGIDMTRDMRDRLREFTTQDWLNAGRCPAENGSATTVDILDSMAAKCGTTKPPVELRRIALTMDQVEEYGPPPNPAKLTDSRVAGYLDRYGDESWELDALDPATLDALISEHIEGEIEDPDAWDEANLAVEAHRATLALAAQEWDSVVVPALALDSPED